MIPSDLPPALLALATALAPRRGEMLFHQGDAATAIYFVKAGCLRLQRHGRDGEEVSLHDARGGEFCAEASLASPRYHCDALAVVDSEVLRFPSDPVKALLRDDADFAGAWIQLLSRQLRGARARVERLSLRSAAERVLHLLGSEGRGPRREYQPPTSLKDLARDLALTPEALYRTLAQLERDGVIERRDGLLAYRQSRQGD